MEQKTRRSRWGTAAVILAVVAFAAVAMALDSPIIRGHRPYKVSCLSIDAGTTSDTDVTVPLDGGAGISVTMDTYYIGNDSSTCVRFAPVGPVSGSGMRLGQGCRDGSGASVDGMIGACHSEGAAVNVDVIPGQVR